MKASNVLSPPPFGAKRAAPAGRARSARHAGFTLTELVVTIAIAALLAVLAVPAFNGITANERTRALASDLYVSLAAARSQAVRLDQPVTVQQQGSGWQQGWITTYSGASGTVTLDTHGATPGASVSGPDQVVYYPSGRLYPGVAPMFVISTQSGGSTFYQCVSIDPAGDPYMQAAATC